MNKSVYRILKISGLSNENLIALEIIKDKNTPLLDYLEPLIDKVMLFYAMEKAKVEQAPKK